MSATPTQESGLSRNPELLLPTWTWKHSQSSGNGFQPYSDSPGMPTCLSNTFRKNLGRALTRKKTLNPVCVASLPSHTTHKPYFPWVQVTLPAGVLPGHTVTLAGKGTEHPDKLPGSIQVVAVQVAHPRFERLGGARTVHFVTPSIIALCNVHVSVIAQAAVSHSSIAAYSRGFVARVDCATYQTPTGTLGRHDRIARREKGRPCG